MYDASHSAEDTKTAHASTKRTNLEASIAEISEGNMPAGMLRRQSISRKLQGQYGSSALLWQPTAARGSAGSTSSPQQREREHFSDVASAYHRAHTAVLMPTVRDRTGSNSHSRRDRSHSHSRGESPLPAAPFTPPSHSPLDLHSTVPSGRAPPLPQLGEISHAPALDMGGWGSDFSPGAASATTSRAPRPHTGRSAPSASPPLQPMEPAQPEPRAPTPPRKGGRESGRDSGKEAREARREARRDAKQAKVDRRRAQETASGADGRDSRQIRREKAERADKASQREARRSPAAVRAAEPAEPATPLAWATADTPVKQPAPAPTITAAPAPRPASPSRGQRPADVDITVTVEDPPSQPASPRAATPASHISLSQSEVAVSLAPTPTATPAPRPPPTDEFQGTLPGGLEAPAPTPRRCAADSEEEEEGRTQLEDDSGLPAGPAPPTGRTVAGDEAAALASAEMLRLRRLRQEEEEERELAQEQKTAALYEALSLKAAEQVTGAAARYSKLVTMAGRHAFCSPEDLYNLITTPHDALLMSHIAKPLLRIVDCRPRGQFLAEHIRGSLFLTEVTAQAARNALNTTPHFEQRAAALDPRNTIVFYSTGDEEEASGKYSRHHAALVQAIAMVDDGVSRLFTLKGGLADFKAKFPFLVCGVRHDLSYEVDDSASVASWGSSGIMATIRRRTRSRNRRSGGYASSRRSFTDQDEGPGPGDELPRHTIWHCPFGVPRSEMPYLRSIASKQGISLSDDELNGFYQNGHRIPGTSAFEFDPDLNVYPNLILDSWLFLGDQRCSWSLAALIDLRITHIINISTDICNYFEDHPAAQLPGGSYIKYLTIRMHDDRHSDIQSQFELVNNFIDMAKKTDPRARIMVHCQMGISRSASLVISYILHLTRCSLKDIYYYVKARRYIVQPNSGFWLQLANVEKHKLGATTVFDVLEAGLRREQAAKCNCCSIM